MSSPFQQIKLLDVEERTNLNQKRQTNPVAIDEGIAKAVAPERTMDQLLKELDETLLDQGEYNSVIDGELYRETGRQVDPAHMRALKNSNRLMALENQELIMGLKASFHKGVSQSLKIATYDPERQSDLHALMQLKFNVDSASINGEQYLQLKELEVEMIQSERSGILSTSNLDLPSLNEGGGSDVRFSLRVVTEGIDTYEDSYHSLEPNEISVANVLAMGYTSVLDMEAQNAAVMETLDGIDGETTYIEAAVGRDLDTPINLTVGGRPSNYSMKEIWENCFDCFHSKWNGEPDFKFSLGMELKLREVIQTINVILKGIRVSLDLPSRIEANVCSLQGLGALCPVEIAFLLNSLVSLLQMVITENLFDLKGFISKLIGSLLNPLFGALSTGIGLAVGPMAGYTDCVFETILSNRQVADTVNPLVTQARAQIAGRTISLDSVLGNSELDPMDLVMAATGEFEQRMHNARDWILGSLEGLRIWASSNSGGQVNIFAKVIALSSLIAVVAAIARFTSNNVVTCEEVLNPDTGAIEVVPTFESEEFLSLIDLSPFSTIQRPGDIVDGTFVPSDEDAPSVIINTETGSKFTLFKCGKGRTNTVSDFDARLLLQQLGL